MARISGVDLDDHKRIDIALTRIYGIGRKNVVRVLTGAKVVGSTRVKQLTNEELLRIQQAIEKLYKVEGDLRREIQDNIKRLRAIGTYRGQRHARGLPVRGQRTRSNARTKRGKRVTVGALKKDIRAKIEKPVATAATSAPATEGKAAPK